MKRRLLALLLAPFSAFALERDLVNGIESVAGIYSSIYLHEAGHALAFKLAGATDILIEVPRPGSVLGGLTTARVPAPLSSDQRQFIAVSGLVASSLAAEVVMQRQGLHRSAYAQSLLGTAVTSNLIHVYQYYAQVRGVNGWAGNDIDQYELSGGNPHGLSSALTAYSLWTLSRMRKNNIPLMFVNLRF
jgi:hypothetical protein